MLWKSLIALELALLCVPASAAVVTDTEIVAHHGDRVPRFARVLPGEHLIVPAGQTVTLPADSTFDAIEVAGTLRVERTGETVCRFTHLTVLPGGTLDLGTVADPVTGRVELIVRDVPIDAGTAASPGVDPFQWGNGIIVFGRWTSHGRPIAETWVRVDGQLEAGQTTFNVSGPLAGWEVGDAVLIPDTRQMVEGRGAVKPQREDGLTVAAISGNTITLNRPLAFARPQWWDSDGNLVGSPYAANATRNVVVRSENQAGSAGHTACLMHSDSDVRYTAFTGLGRTLPKPLHNTLQDASGRVTQIGTNQVGRYLDHLHHVRGPMEQAAEGGPTFRRVGNFVDGGDAAKWGVVVHGTHDGIVEWNVVDRCVGAGVVTEDGHEVRNRIARNFVTGSRGAGGLARNIHRGDPGSEGAGFWFHGSQNTVVGNVSAGNHVGFGVVHILSKTALVPKSPGAQPTVEVVGRRTLPIDFSGNVAFGNASTGVELWDASGWSGTHQVLYGNGGRGFWMGVAGDAANNVSICHATVLRNDGKGEGISTNVVYNNGLSVCHSRIEGFAAGLREAHGAITLDSLLLANVRNIDWSHWQSADFYRASGQVTARNIRCRPWAGNPATPGNPEDHVRLGDGRAWAAGDKLGRPTVWRSGGPQILFYDWQGAPGHNFALYAHAQGHAAAAFPLTPPYYGGCPEAGLTMQQCWDKYGLAMNGHVACPNPESIPGVLGLACPFDDEPEADLGAPRVVLLHPSRINPIQPGDARLVFNMVLTGDRAQANDKHYLSIDGGPTVVGGPQQGLSWEMRRLDAGTQIPVSPENLTPGAHTVRTWREHDDNGVVAGSELLFSYTVSGDAPEPPLDDAIEQLRPNAHSP